MKTLVIPDIHSRWELAEQIIQAAEPWDHCVLLGDYFDSFDPLLDSLNNTEDAARWLRDKLTDPRYTCLVGNHEMPYFHGPERFGCSGYTDVKSTVINRIITPDLARRMPLAYMTEGWLLSHAGFHPKYIQHVGDPVGFAAMAMDHLWEHGRAHDVILDDEAGVLWIRSWLWPLLEPDARFGQIFGHTPDKIVRRYRGDCICLDTHLRHFAMIEDGKLAIHKTADILRTEGVA